MENCCVKECKSPATCMPQINVPATGWPLDQHQPLSMIVGLRLCDVHYKAAKIGDFLHDGLGSGKSTKEIFRIMANGRVPPDFARAYLSRVALDSKEAAILHGQGRVQ